MPTGRPLVATARMQMPLIISSISHVFSVYVRGLTPVSTSWNINTRTLDANDLDWKAAAQGWWDAFSYMLDDAVGAPTIKLEELQSGVWVQLDDVAVTGGNGSGTTNPASQFTFTLRDKEFKPDKVVWLDAVCTPPGRANAITDWTTNISNALKQYTSAHTVTNPPFSWQASRANQFLHDAPVVGMVATFNRKLRRRRGLA